MHDISVVITTHNHIDITMECLNSLYESIQSKFDLIVVDDNSTDGTVKKIKSKYPLADIIVNTDVQSLSREWNDGIKRAWENGSNYACVINNDMLFPDKAWLDKLVYTFDTNDYQPTAVVSPCSYNWANKIEGDIIKEYIGYYGHTQTFFPPERTMIFPDNDNFPKVEFDQYLYTGFSVVPRYFSRRIYPTLSMYGGCFIITPEATKKIGYFDEEIAFSHDEKDYSYRIWENDMTSVIDTTVRVIHRGGTVSKAGLYDLLINKSKELNKSIVRPEWMFMNKHLPQKVERMLKFQLEPYLKQKGIIFHPLSYLPLEIPGDVRNEEPIPS